MEDSTESQDAFSIKRSKLYIVLFLIIFTSLTISLCISLWFTTQMAFSVEDEIQQLKTEFEIKHHFIETNLKCTNENIEIINDKLNEINEINEKQEKTLKTINDKMSKYNTNKDIVVAIYKEAGIYNINPDLIFNLIDAESSFDTTAKSHVGATGLMQIMPNTGSMLAKELGIENYSLNDPKTNIKLGTFYLYTLHNKYNDWHTVLTAYNRGEGGMRKYRSINGTSRSGYSRKVLKGVQNENFR